MKYTVAIFAVLLLASCQREERDLRAMPPARPVIDVKAPESDLRPGGPLPEQPVSEPYNGNAKAIAEGQRLYNWYNCSGCHFNGGGGIGPPLMNETFVYGREPANIFDSIVKGRPNGMPSWGRRIPEYQIWEIVAFVRSLSGQQPTSATPARVDTLHPSSKLR